MNRQRLQAEDKLLYLCKVGYTKAVHRAIVARLGRPKTEDTINGVTPLCLERKNEAPTKNKLLSIVSLEDVAARAGRYWLWIQDGQGCSCSEMSSVNGA